MEKRIIKKTLKGLIAAALISVTAVCMTSVCYAQGEYTSSQAPVVTPDVTVNKVSKVTASRSGKPVKLSWSKSTGADGYLVFACVSSKWQQKAETSDLSCTLTDIPWEASLFGVKAYKEEDGIRYMSDMTTVSRSAPSLGKVTGLYAAETKERSIKLCWDKLSNCDGYSVYLKYSDGYKEVAKTTANTYNVTGLEPSWRRHFVVRAYRRTANGSYLYGAYSDPLRTATCPDTVSGLRSSKMNGTSITLVWNKLACTNYIVYQMMSDGKWHRIAKPVTNSYTVTGLNYNTNYKFVIRACKLDDYKKEHLGWLSNILTVKTDRNTIVVKNGITYVNGILIANKTYPLPASYNPGKLTDETYNAFIQMKNAAARDGYSLWICSGFRSYETQRYLYNNYCARDGKAAADTYSARPGHSEHQTGLAFDINYASSWFDNTAEAKWIANNCWKYGFIIRYPKGKQNITGYKYESWHVRYLGKDLAKKVYDSGLCLEEYLGITSKYSY